MKKNVKAMYVAPMVELLEARVEKGFAGSAAEGPTIPTVGVTDYDNLAAGSNPTINDMNTGWED